MHRGFLFNLSFGGDISCRSWGVKELRSQGVKGGIG